MNEAILQARDAIQREDYDAAVQLLRPLADAEDAEAQFLLGYLYFTSADVSQDESRAWLQRAGAHGHPDALYYLGCLGDVFSFGPPEDDVRRTLLVRAAELGSAQAQRDLGCFYATGEGGFSKDETLGRLWYGRAAAQGHEDALYNHALMLLHGEGGPADPMTARATIRRGAAAGNHWMISFLENCPEEMA